MTPLAVSIDTLLSNGLTVGGQRATKAVFTLPDGRKVRVDLPTVTDVSVDTLSGLEASILDVVRKSKVALTAKEIADKCGNKTEKGYFGIVLRKMVSAGVLIRTKGVYTDDPNKLPKPEK